MKKIDSSKVRCAVIGLGMGRNHCKFFNESEEAELVAVADLDEARHEPWLPVVGSEHCYRDYKEMLCEVAPDVVGIALPNFLHAPVTIDALEAGCHVLCEKPMAMNVEEALRMRDAADRAGRQLGINLSYRFSPQARALKNLADNDYLGRAYHAFTRWTRLDGMPGFGGWFGQKELSGGGPLIDLGVHRLDLAMWLMGGPTPVTVSGVAHHEIGVPKAKQEGAKFDVEDFAGGFVRFSNGATMLFEVSWAGFQREAEMMATRVMGTEGTLIHRNTDGGYTFTAECIRRESGQMLKSTVMAPSRDFRNPYAEFVHCVKQEKPFLAGPEDGLRIQRILDALYASAEQGREIEITE